MLYFTRHGQTETNVHEIFALPEDGLTQMGIQQAQRIAKTASEAGITRIISSPLTRARQTAQTIAADLGIESNEIKFDPNLAERCLGVLEGVAYNGLTTATVPDDTEGAETREAVFLRAKKLLGDYLQVSEPTLLVGHAGIYRFIMTALKDGDISDVKNVGTFTQGEIVKLTT